MPQKEILFSLTQLLIIQHILLNLRITPNLILILPS